MIIVIMAAALLGDYPYFFIDVNTLGYSGVAIWSGALMAALIVLGTIMWRVDRWQAGRGRG